MDRWVVVNSRDVPVVCLPPTGYLTLGRSARLSRIASPLEKRVHGLVSKQCSEPHKCPVEAASIGLLIRSEFLVRKITLLFSVSIY